MILVAIALATLIAVPSCRGDDDAPPTAESASKPPPTAPLTTTPPTTTPPITTPPTTVPATILGGITATDLGASWHDRCPVAPSDLRALAIPYVDFDGIDRVGTLIVNADVATAVTQTFARLYADRYPIERMVPVSEYAADDDRSTKANNTSAFNCRAITGGGQWSLHASGHAVDINPVQNPYVYADGHVLDPAAEPFIDRSRTDRAMIHDADTVVSAFAAIGWGWGGHYNRTKDYQHFSTTGG